MKIKSTDSTSAAGGVRKTGKARPASGGDFSSYLQETEETKGVKATTGVGSIDALLSLQGMESATDGNAKARQQGEDILNILDGILHDLLSGGISVKRLHTLVDMMQRQRSIKDVSPKMLEIIDEIETRALVELAKYEADMG